VLRRLSSGFSCVTISSRARGRGQQNDALQWLRAGARALTPPLCTPAAARLRRKVERWTTTGWSDIVKDVRGSESNCEQDSRGM